MVVVLLLAAAGALWGAGEVSWTPELDLDPAEPVLGTGTTTSTAAADDAPGLTPLALLSLAGLAGVFAAGGWARRLLGGVLALAGGFAGWQAISTDVPGGFDLLTGRGVALLGAVLLVAAGVLVVWFAGRLPVLGARYQLANATGRSGDPDKDMWDGLSDGEDPTTDGR